MKRIRKNSQVQGVEYLQQNHNIPMAGILN